MSTLFHNCQVWLGPSENDWTNELYVVDGIVRKRDESSEPQTVIDLDGAFVYPGFRDGHSHPLFAARELSGLVLTQNASLARILDQVQEFAEANPSLAWIDGGSYRASILQTDAIGAAFLDAAVSDRPVVLHCDDRHSLWVNSAALRAAKLVSASDHRTVVGIERSADGTPTGVLRDWEAMNLVMSQAPAISAEEDLSALYAAERILIGQGICQVQDAWIDETNSNTYVLAARNGLLKISYSLAYRCTAEDWKVSLDAAKKLRTTLARVGNEYVSLNAVKIFLDGSFGSGTASIFGASDNLLWSSPDLSNALSAIDAAGFQIHLHAIGDRVVNQALNALEQMNSSGSWHSKRVPVITHCELIADADVPRFSSLGVIANVQPSWAQLDESLKTTIGSLPKEAQPRLYRFGDLLTAGAMVSFGSDWPVSYPDALNWLNTATTRQTCDGSPEAGWMPTQRLSMSQALTCATRNVALQLGSEESGSLHQGQTADFVTASTNLFDSPSEVVGDRRISALYIAGERVTAET